ncbi:biotin--[acetyl-CoA-carboxylase] ligase [uncultured Muribaculum sp.]|uniref:biotin--[acetyl-CoA-carboxylase] ligase n=1 Tax=uncultured Muribaculum sp. TaxID=1918613 RepID=UPI002638C9A3|nr:biotin--[acetyl-CoA-carboxylase] ligase [uncultured Muribaculum sp.]
MNTTYTADKPIITWLDEVGSTSTYLAQVLTDNTPSGTVIAARCQNAGRGQRGNTWEAEPGKNLSFSMLIKPNGIPARCQFRISQAVALAIVSVLRPMLPGSKISIKWPNDIYADNKKICGILIENTLIGAEIAHCIAGIGINVNQAVFLSDAPNPVSIIQLTKQETALEPLLEKLASQILLYLTHDAETLHNQYMNSLWRKNNSRYRDVSTGREFEAEITDIGPMGHMTLTDTNGRQLTYAFKEVAAILPSINND